VSELKVQEQDYGSATKQKVTFKTWDATFPPEIDEPNIFN